MDQASIEKQMKEERSTFSIWLPRVAVIGGLCIVFIGGALLLYVNRNAQQNNSCEQNTKQFCGQIACEGADTGLGLCKTGGYCCNKANFTLPIASSATIVSDIKSVPITNVDKTRITSVANSLGMFNNPSATYHDVKGTLTQGKIKTLTIRVTNITSAPLYSLNVITPAIGKQSAGNQSGYGDVVDSRNEHMTIFVYVSDPLIQSTAASTLKQQVWAVTLHAMYDVIYPPTLASVNGNANTFISANNQSIPFTLNKI